MTFLETRHLPHAAWFTFQWFQIESDHRNNPIEETCPWPGHEALTGNVADPEHGQKKQLGKVHLEAPGRKPTRSRRAVEL